MEQKQKVERFVHLNKLAKKGQILFTGSSLMEHFPINELLMSRGMSHIIYNRGIGGFTTDDMLQAMEETVFGTMPAKIFMNIGTNDIATPNYSLKGLIENYGKILGQIKERLPKTQVYLMAYYPVNEVDKVPDNEWGRHMFDTRNNENIKLANEAVKDLAERMGYEYINVNQGLENEEGRLKKEYTVEGVHMYANAYNLILDHLLPYLLD